MKIWDVGSGDLLTAIETPPERGARFAFSPDGRTLATAGYDKAIRLWDVASRTPIGEPLRGHADEASLTRHLWMARA